MNKLNYLIYLLLVLIIILLLYSIFFGENNYPNRNFLLKENTSQKLKNEAIKKENEILEFEIKNAQNSNDHVENFAREKLNLTYPEEEFLSFEEEKKDDERE
jgi:cell division protein FtsB